MNRIVFGLLVLFSSSVALAQSPWTKEKGKAFVQLGGSSITYTNVKLNGVATGTGRNNSDVTAQAYAEYGVTKKLEGTLILPYKFLSYKNSVTGISQSFSGLSNITVGAKYKLLDKKFKVSGGVFFQANTIDQNPLLGFRTGFDANTILPYITAGSTWKDLYYYANVGYGYMDNNHYDFVKVYAEAGYEVLKGLHVIGLLDVRTLLSNGSVINPNNTNYLMTANYLDRQEYVATGLKINYEFVKDKYGVNFSSIGAPSFDNTPAAGSMNLGVYVKL